ncbi:methylated-DNA--[protein]-cysteine S-methyltransferase [Streptomyces tsukubensis]|uniref:Methylated-DNA--protein-cysteine methyltransferase n=1 Tax=Streptomyces tsukubensis TaxID=83656 RepID=A0A1V4A9B2_9ACTN|nr:methylated-DNA--[protein]-cysteine S-methyltransferase [Streptomyces tsukubensis]OON80028.1 cysteine methyltransferase [Streptomyces tsukubensis]QFR97260.1 methylated-DNA--[protein]-cysteine S-methyltransferase [Streptomyces tsukubensis]
MNTRHAIVPTPLGDLTVVASGESLVGVYFPHHWYLPPSAELGPETDAGQDPPLARAAAQLGEYLAGERTSFDLATETHGDPLQEQVWAMLRRIPFGTTTTYGALAEQLGNKGLAQTVGQAVGHNPLSIIVPCHRVVGSNGKLTGFAGGLSRKQRLLELEEPAEVRAGRLF